MSFHLLALILHVFGAGVVIGVVVLSVIAVIKPPMNAATMDKLHFAGRAGMAASAWQFFTGLMLVIPEWSEFRSNRLFWTKMTLYVVEGTLASMLLTRQSKQVWEQTKEGQNVPGNKLRTTLWLHAALILAIAAVGVVLVSGGETE